jgi:hypothetical protein
LQDNTGENNMWLHNETVIKTPKSLKVGDVTYPSAIFKDADLLAELGITPYTENRVDNRYYWTGNVTIVDNVGTYEAIPRDVEQLKESMLGTINSQVASIQGSIDWYWSRADKGGKVVPTEIEEFASTIYKEQTIKEAEVAALTTLEDVMLYEATPYTEVRKIKHTSDEGVQTYGPETDEYNREINMTMHWTANPMDDVDPSFVSLTAV